MTNEMLCLRSRYRQFATLLLTIGCLVSSFTAAAIEDSRPLDTAEVMKATVDLPPNDTKEFMRRLSEVTAKNPNNAVAFYVWGKTLADLHREEEALEKYRRAVQIEPGYLQNVSTEGERLASVGSNDEAIRQFRFATRLAPRNASAFYEWTITLIAVKKTEEAAEKFRTSIELGLNDRSRARACKFLRENSTNIPRQCD